MRDIRFDSIFYNKILKYELSEFNITLVTVGHSLHTLPTLNQKTIIYILRSRFSAVSLYSYKWFRYNLQHIVPHFVKCSTKPHKCNVDIQLKAHTFMLDFICSLPTRDFELHNVNYIKGRSCEINQYRKW